MLFFLGVRGTEFLEEEEDLSYSRNELESFK